MWSVYGTRTAVNTARFSQQHSYQSRIFTVTPIVITHTTTPSTTTTTTTTLSSTLQTQQPVATMISPAVLMLSQFHTSSAQHKSIRTEVVQELRRRVNTDPGFKKDVQTVAPYRLWYRSKVVKYNTLKKNFKVIVRLSMFRLVYTLEYGIDLLRKFLYTYASKNKIPFGLGNGLGQSITLPTTVRKMFGITSEITMQSLQEVVPIDKSAAAAAAVDATEPISKPRTKAELEQARERLRKAKDEAKRRQEEKAKEELMKVMTGQADAEINAANQVKAQIEATAAKFKPRRRSVFSVVSAHIHSVTGEPLPGPELRSSLRDTYHQLITEIPVYDNKRESTVILENRKKRFREKQAAKKLAFEEELSKKLKEQEFKLKEQKDPEVEKINMENITMTFVENILKHIDSKMINEEKAAREKVEALNSEAVEETKQEPTIKDLVLQASSRSDSVFADRLGDFVKAARTAPNRQAEKLRARLSNVKIAPVQSTLQFEREVRDAVADIRETYETTQNPTIMKFRDASDTFAVSSTTQQALEVLNRWDPNFNVFTFEKYMTTFFIPIVIRAIRSSDIDILTQTLDTRALMQVATVAKGKITANRYDVAGLNGVFNFNMVKIFMHKENPHVSISFSSLHPDCQVDRHGNIVHGKAAKNKTVLNIWLLRPNFEAQDFDWILADFQSHVLESLSA